VNINHENDPAQPLPEFKVKKLTAIVMMAIMLALVITASRSFANNSHTYEEFIVKQSVALALQVQNNSQEFIGELLSINVDKSIVEFWKRFSTYNLSAPKSLKIITISHDFATGLVHTMGSRNASYGLVDRFTPISTGIWT